MEFYSVEHWQKNWSSLISRVEKGEDIGIVNEKGNKGVITLCDDEQIKLYTELNNEAS